MNSLKYTITMPGYAPNEFTHHLTVAGFTVRDSPLSMITRNSYVYAPGDVFISTIKWNCLRSGKITITLKGVRAKSLVRYIKCNIINVRDSDDIRFTCIFSCIKLDPILSYFRERQILIANDTWDSESISTMKNYSEENSTFYLSKHVIIVAFFGHLQHGGFYVSLELRGDCSYAQTKEYSRYCDEIRRIPGLSFYDP